MEDKSKKEAGEVGMAVYCLWRGNHSSDIV